MECISPFNEYSQWTSRKQAGVMWFLFHVLQPLLIMFTQQNSCCISKRLMKHVHKSHWQSNPPPLLSLWLLEVKGLGFRIWKEFDVIGRCILKWEGISCDLTLNFTNIYMQVKNKAKRIWSTSCKPRFIAIDRRKSHINPTRPTHYT